MKVRIRDIDKTPMWTLVNLDNSIVLHLSSEGNEFKEIDYTLLTPYQKQTLWSAIKMKTIEAQDDEEFQEDFRSMLKIYLEKRQKSQTSHLREIFGVESSSSVSGKQAVESVNRANEIKKIMENSVSTLKRLLVDFSASDLEVAFKIEQLGKGRKTVLNLVGELISKQVKKNASKTENSNVPSQEEFENRQIFKGSNRVLLPKIPVVRESEKEQIVIKI